MKKKVKKARKESRVTAARYAGMDAEQEMVDSLIKIYGDGNKYIDNALETALMSLVGRARWGWSKEYILDVVLRGIEISEEQTEKEEFRNSLN